MESISHSYTKDPYIETMWLFWVQHMDHDPIGNNMVLDHVFQPYTLE